MESYADTPDPRLRELVTSLVRHLHAFVKDTEPTIAEWEQAIRFLTAAGHKSDDERQEFILLSDVLGISMLVETINNRKFGGATESTVLGPFHVVASPRKELGDSIDQGRRPGTAWADRSTRRISTSSCSRTAHPDRPRRWPLLLRPNGPWCLSPAPPGAAPASRAEVPGFRHVDPHLLG